MAIPPLENSVEMEEFGTWKSVGGFKFGLDEINGFRTEKLTLYL